MFSDCALSDLKTQIISVALGLQYYRKEVVCNLLIFQYNMFFANDLNLLNKWKEESFLDVSAYTFPWLLGCVGG